MKIDEPKTPYEYDQDHVDEEDEDGEAGASKVKDGLDNLDLAARYSAVPI